MVGDIVLRAVAVLAAFLVLPLLVGQAEHKVMAHMQGRLGPMYAGAFHGWAQLVADGVKFVQKEAVTPAAADKSVFALAPGVALVPYLVALAAVPFEPDHCRRPSRRRTVVRARRIGRRSARHPHGRLGQRQQVLDARRNAHCGTASQL